MKRERKRYILVKLLAGESRPSRDLFEGALKSSIRALFGEFGLAEVGPRVVSFDAEGSSAIIACRLEALSKLRLALAAINKVGESPAAVLVLKVSGTIKGARRLAA